MARQVFDHSVWKSLLRSVGRAVGDRSNAEDLLQAAFVKLEEYRARVPVENERAFLQRTAVNLAIDEHRSARVRRACPDGMTELLDLRDPLPLQDEVLLAQERLQRVRAALDGLSPRTREIFLMHRLDGVKYSEIAARLGISVSAVEKHIAKAVLLIAQDVDAG